MKSTSQTPVICIVGRPNVGKSSLFNCLIKKRTAVVVEQSGTTRDRVEAFTHMGETGVKIVDTGGYHAKDKGHIPDQVKEQIYSAIDEASILLLVTDSISGLVPADEEVAALLRTFDKPVILIANKSDNEKILKSSVEFYKLGFGEPLGISCLHRRGITKLMNQLAEFAGDETVGQKPEEENPSLKIAVVGRPNVGKSSFVNKLLTRNRVIVSDTPGTTRDSIDTYFNYDGDNFILIDTAGIRHKRKVKEPVDVYSIMRAKESIERCDVAVLLIDASDGVTRDDLGILGFIEENGKACLIIVNKWDLADEIENVNAEIYEKDMTSKFQRISKFPVTFMSAKTGKKVLDTLPIIKVINADLDHKASTGFLNDIFRKNDPSLLAVPRNKKRPNFLYIVQSRTRPVEFKFFVNDPRNVLPAHISFIENLLRKKLPLKGIPIKIKFRTSRKEGSFGRKKK